jgi:hypothetical protein
VLAPAVNSSTGSKLAAKDGSNFTNDSSQHVFKLRNSFDVAPAQQPSAFMRPLSPAQLHSLGWMLQRENHSQVYTSTQIIRQALSETDVCVELKIEREFEAAKGGILGDQCGYGKTACMIALITETMRGSTLESPKSPQWLAIAGRRVFTNATLIVTPPNLFDQWLREFRKFVSPAAPMHIVAVPSHSKLRSLTVRDFVAADVVLVSFRFFFSGAYQRHFDEFAFLGLKVWDDATSKRSREAAEDVTSACGRGSRLGRRGRGRPKHTLVGSNSSTADKNTLCGVCPATTDTSVRTDVAESSLRVKTEIDQETVAASLTSNKISLKDDASVFGLPPADNNPPHGEQLTGEGPRDNSTTPGPQLSKYYVDLRGREDYVSQRYLAAERRTSRMLGNADGEEILRSQVIFEMFCFKRIVFDEFHEVALATALQPQRSAPSAALPFYALHALQGRMHWGLTATPLLSSPASVAQMASLLKVFIPHDDAAEAKRFLDEWVTSNTSDCSKTPLEEHWISVELSAPEMALYLYQRNALAQGGAAAAGCGSEARAAERRLLQYCSHFDPDAAEVGSHSWTVLEKVLQGQQQALEEACKRMQELKVQREELLERCGARDLLQAAVPASAREATLVCAHCSLQEVSRLAEAAATSKECFHIAELAKIEGDLRCLAQRLMEGATHPAQTLHTTDICQPCVNLSSWEDQLKQLNRSQGHVSSDQRHVELRLRFLQEVCACVVNSAAVNYNSEATAAVIKCHICLGDIPAGTGALLPCGHRFHHACAQAKLSSTACCPLCQRPSEVQMLTNLQEFTERVRTGSGEEMNPTRAQYGSKVAKVLETVSEIQRKEGDATKCLIFVQWESLLAQIESALRSAGWSPLTLRGNLTQRQKVIASFVDGLNCRSSILLLSLQKGTVGMNLVCAHHILLVHPMHSESIEEAVNFELQALGRVRRQGQCHTVHMYRFFSQDTIEEMLARRHHAAFLKEQHAQAIRSAAEVAQLARCCPSLRSHGVN